MGEQNQIKILVIDDEINMCRVIQAALQDVGYPQVVINADPSRSLKMIDAEEPDIIITDLKMEPVDGMEILRYAKSKGQPIEVLVMTAYATAETAVESMKLGAVDYIFKPFKMDELLLIINRIQNTIALSRENLKLKEALKEKYTYKNIIGNSGAMQGVFKLVEKVAASDSTVLIRGESGTGKELIARLIHNLSRRKDQQFFAINISAFPETLLESELFGHEKGAFTGAVCKKIGFFEAAHHSTLLLDEIGDMLPSTQVKILRVIQEKEYIPLGSSKRQKTDVRIITATNKNLEEAIINKIFREDLYYRLNVFPIFLPPLRNRIEDIPELTSYFLKKHAFGNLRVSPEVFEHLKKHTWPGNIRELENVVERMALMTEGDLIEARHLPEEMNLGPIFSGNIFDFEIPDSGILLEAVEQDLIRKALIKANGNKTKAAELLGITRRTLYSRLEKFEKQGEESE